MSMVDMLLLTRVPADNHRRENSKKVCIDEDDAYGGSDGCGDIGVPESILVSEIFWRLPRLRDVATARCVCKRWNRLLSSWEFGNVWHGKRKWMWGELWFTQTYAHHKWERVRFTSLMLGLGFGFSPWKPCSRSTESASPSPWPFLAGSRSFMSMGGHGWSTISASSACAWLTNSHRVEVASSHGLLLWARMDAVFTKVRGLVVQNPASRKSKRLPWPSSPGCSNKTIPMQNPVDRLFCGRFIEHDLRLQRYKLFLCCAGFHPTQKSAFLFDSAASMAWDEIIRKRIPSRRLCSSDGFRFRGDENSNKSSSVMIIKYTVDPAAEDPEKQVTMVAFDSGSKTWDELHLRLRNTRISTSNSGSRSYIYSATVSTDCTPQVCRVIGIDEEGKNEEERMKKSDKTKMIISLWELVVVEDDDDEVDGVGFDLVSSTTCTQSLGFEMWEWRARIIRSDEEAFVAVVVLHDDDDNDNGNNNTNSISNNRWAMVVIGYDVVTGSWNVTTPPHVMLLHNSYYDDGSIIHNDSPAFFLYPSLWSSP